MQIFLRYFFTIWGATFVYHKISNIKTSFINTIMNELIVSLISSLIISSFAFSIAPIRIVLMIILTHTLISFKTNISLKLSFFISIISYGFSFGVYCLSSAFLSTICVILFPNIQSSSMGYTTILFIIGFTHLISLSIIFRIEQMKKGIKQLILNNYSVHSLLISLSIIVFISIASNNLRHVSSLHSISSIFSLIIALFIPSYWRYRIKQTYIENMRRLEVLSYENAIADRDKQILDLKEENAQLGRIIHKYRKVIPAMELSVMDLLQNSDELSRDNLKERSQALQIQLAEMREEPDNLLAQYQKGRIVTTQTGLHTVDAMIALMEKRVKQEQIRYKVQTEPDIRELALRSVKEPDLLHLLGDLLENAIHAESTTDTKELLIYFGRLNDCLLLEVLDSGVPFDIRTYQHLGQEAYTSHEQDGGSGTGLMDIWKIKRKYKASLYIYEYESNVGNYTKKISFLFDGKNHFLLKTYRDKEIRNALIRGDLHVFPHETD